MSRHRVTTVLGLISIALGACSDRSLVAPRTVAASANGESAVMATGGPRALSGTYRVDSISLETRYWDASSALPNSANATAVFNALPTTVPGYTNEPWLMPDLAARIDDIYTDVVWADTSYLGVANPAGAHKNLASRYHVALTALTASVVTVEVGVDLRGGVMFVDGVNVAEDWNYPWWKGSFLVDTNSYAGCTTYVAEPCIPKWSRNKGVLGATVALSVGRHVIEVVGFEDGDDAGAAARIDAGSGFQPMIAFNQPAQQLSVTGASAGGGRVTSTPAGINCPTTCTASFPLASTVTLTPTPDPNVVFAGWTGACTGLGACTVSMYRARTVGASFSAVPLVQGITMETRYWNGAPVPSSSLAALAFFQSLPTNVAGYTNEPVPVQTLVQNTALFTPPNVGMYRNLGIRAVVTMVTSGRSQVDFRLGGDFGAGATVLLDGAELATNWAGGVGGPFLYASATLAAGTHTVTLVGFEDCCEGFPPSFEYNYGTGWNSATAPALPSTPLVVSVPTSATSGRVVSVPAGIDCGQTCQAAFTAGSQVTLSATPAPYFAFDSWGGACSGGSGACVVRMLQPSRSVTASFVRTAWPVTVRTAGTGAGSVALFPSGSPCGVDCWAFAPGTVVTATATAAATSDFRGWNVAGCTSATCTITVNAEFAATAQFDLKTIPLSVSRSGAGTGTVSSAPAGINCGILCVASFPLGSTVALSAAAASGSKFMGWTGACAGTAACSVTLAAPASVGARFEKETDVTPPSLSCRADPAQLWPVNHKLRDINVVVTVTDAESGAAGFQLVSVTANEPVNAAGDGNTTADVVGWTLGTADVKGQFRAERQGTEKDRIYTLTYRALDVAGNVATSSCAVTVPHDQGK